MSSDKLIIQLESLLKLDDNLNLFIDDNIAEFPSYDLIIMDEIESILNQFNSPTMKGQAFKIWKYLVNIIHNSNKLIVLDGDISSRTHQFIKQFETSTNLYNNFKANKKNITIIKNKKGFLNDIYENLDNDKKIVIVSQGSNEGRFLEEHLNTKYPHLKVGFYYSKTDDHKKRL